MDFKESQTYKNLSNAFLKELQTAAKYNILCKNALKENNCHLSGVFERNAANELAHAALWKRFLNGGKALSLTEELKRAAAEEKYEWSEMYKKYARTARREGYEQIAKAFENIGAVEYRHDKEFTSLISETEMGKGICGQKDIVLICTNCGHLYRAKCAPVKCPVCGYPHGYFEIYSE